MTQAAQQAIAGILIRLSWNISTAIVLGSCAAHEYNSPGHSSAVALVHSRLHVPLSYQQQLYSCNCRYQEKANINVPPAGSYPNDPVDEYREHFGLSGRPGQLLNVQLSGYI